MAFIVHGILIGVKCVADRIAKKHASFGDARFSMIFRIGSVSMSPGR